VPGESDSWDHPPAAEAYAEAVRHGRLYRRLARELVELLDPPPETCALDLACGTGIVLESLSAALGPRANLLGVDRSPAMLGVARAQLPSGMATLLRADPARLPLGDAALDAVTCSAALWHFPALGRVFEDAARCLRARGVLAFNAPAAQLSDLEDLPPAPLLTVLGEEGRRRFGAVPAPAGPTLSRQRLLGLAREAGLEPIAERDVTIRVTQDELLALVELPAFGGRLYPHAPPAERSAWIADASARVAGREEAPLLWRSFLLRRKSR
jgi:SAM-dependent methyltransferase